MGRGRGGSFRRGGRNAWRWHRAARKRRRRVCSRWRRRSGDRWRRRGGPTNWRIRERGARHRRWRRVALWRWWRRVTRDRGWWRRWRQADQGCGPWPHRPYALLTLCLDLDLRSRGRGFRGQGLGCGLLQWSFGRSWRSQELGCGLLQWSFGRSWRSQELGGGLRRRDLERSGRGRLSNGGGGGCSGRHAHGLQHDPRHFIRIVRAPVGVDIVGGRGSGWQSRSITRWPGWHRRRLSLNACALQFLLTHDIPWVSYTRNGVKHCRSCECK